MKTTEKLNIRHFEDWQIEKGYSIVYTENPVIARELRKEFGEPAVYEIQGRTFGWHFKVPRRLISVLRDKVQSLSLMLGSRRAENVEKKMLISKDLREHDLALLLQEESLLQSWHSG